jgi:hypothetical protein
MNQPKMNMVARMPDAKSEATKVDAFRAVAEVQAAIQTAKAMPRSVDLALDDVFQSCSQIEFAERAFYSVSKGGGEKVQRPSIHMAVELARAWGNIQYGVRELARDDDKHQSEMLAYAYDLQTNAKAEATFIVPHVIDLKGGAKKVLTASAAIYENNANHGARRLREMILRVVPAWVTEKASAWCYETLRQGGGDEPLPVRIAAAIKSMQEIGISRERLEAKLGASSSWTDVDLAGLRVSYAAIRRGENSAVDEFPPLGVAAPSDPPPAGSKLDALEAKVAKPSPSAPPKPPAPADEDLIAEGGE